MPGPHDLGGKDFGPIDRTDHPPTAFDTRVDALLHLIGGSGARLWQLDEFRRAIERLPPKDYYRLSYYQKWLSAIRTLLTEKGVVTSTELEKRLEALRRETP